MKKGGASLKLCTALMALIYQKLKPKQLNSRALDML
jgi:hypothetical protein